jgi:beta-1,4-mannosyltransferase
MKVLYSHGPLKATDNPYLHELVGGVAEHDEVEFLSPVTALLARPDVLHVHWPKHLVRGASRWRSAVKLATSAVLLWRLRRRGTPVVQTMHNLADHDGETRAERWLFARLDRLVSARIYLNESAENDYAQGVVVLHGSYRHWLERTAGLRYPLAAPTRSLLLFGMLRPYKGIESLVEAATDAGTDLTLAGVAVPTAYGAEIADLLADRPDQSLNERHLDDADLVRLIEEHRLVVLPYRSMYNSGALLYALSVGRPVLTGRTAATESLVEEFGPDWVRLYEPPLSAATLTESLARASADALPTMARRDWADGVALHRAIYAAVRAGSPIENRTRLEQIPAIAAHSARNRP